MTPHDDPEMTRPIARELAGPTFDSIPASTSSSRRGATRRRRLVAGLGALAAVTVGVTSLALAQGGGGEPASVQAASTDSSASAGGVIGGTKPGPTTITSTTVAEPVVVEHEPAATAEPVAEPASRRPRTPAPAPQPAPEDGPETPAEPEVHIGEPLVVERPEPECRNSHDRACGDFYWDPAPPANQPLNASWVEAPTVVEAGVPVTYSVSWSDGDANLQFSNFSVDAMVAIACAMHSPRFGPWDPPAPNPGSGVVSDTLTFTEPGTHTVYVTLSTSQNCDDPYGSHRDLSIEVTVV